MNSEKNVHCGHSPKWGFHFYINRLNFVFLLNYLINNGQNYGDQECPVFSGFIVSI